MRRIEAVTGAYAEAVVAEMQHRLNDIAGALRASPAEAPERVAALQENQRKLERQVAELQRKLATGGSASEVEEVKGVKLAARNLGEVPARDLKGLADAIGKQLGSGVVALVSTAEGKASIVVGVSQGPQSGPSTRWSWCVPRPPRLVARAAVGGLTWRRRVVLMARKPMRRSPRCEARWRWQYEYGSRPACKTGWPACFLPLTDGYLDPDA